MTNPSLKWLRSKTPNIISRWVQKSQWKKISNHWPVVSYSTVTSLCNNKPSSLLLSYPRPEHWCSWSSVLAGQSESAIVEVQGRPNFGGVFREAGLSRAVQQIIRTKELMAFSPPVSHFALCPLTTTVLNTQCYNFIPKYTYFLEKSIVEWWKHHFS